MPRKLLAALIAEGHEADSVKSLQLQGIENGALYQLGASDYDLCFTRDAVFKTCDVEVRRAFEIGSCSDSANPTRRICAAIPHRVFEDRLVKA
jgi:hypothetical protein